MKHVAIPVPAIHPADCRCALCRAGRAGPATRPRAAAGWDTLCLAAALAAFLLVPGRWLAVGAWDAIAAFLA